MLFDTTYTDKKITRQIDAAVGKPFTWKDRFKLGGIGSKRMVISDICEEYAQYINAAHYQSKANIELRPKGIIVHFRYKLESYSWIMPFETLSIKSNEGLLLSSDEKFISFSTEIDQSFINKMMKCFELYPENKS